MAMLHEYGPSRSDIRAAFDTAAAKGQDYLLIIDQLLEDVYNVTVETYTRGVDTSADVLKTLQRDQENAPYSRIRLSHALDLKKDFDAQIKLWHNGGYAETLTPLAATEVDQFHAKQTAKRQQAENRGFFKRLFSRQ